MCQMPIKFFLRSSSRVDILDEITADSPSRDVVIEVNGIPTNDVKTSIKLLEDLKATGGTLKYERNGVLKEVNVPAPTTDD